MYCKHCGKRIPENSKFCRFCGNRISASKVKVDTEKAGGHEEKYYQSNNLEKTNILNNYFNVIKKYADFKGRASRKEYWLFFLANFIIYLGLAFFEGLIGVYPESEESIFITIYQLFIFLPSLAVGVRRMHDANKSGWVLIIPIYNLIVALRKGTPETNKYGSPPKD